MAKAGRSIGIGDDLCRAVDLDHPLSHAFPQNIAVVLAGCRVAHAVKDQLAGPGIDRPMGLIERDQGAGPRPHLDCRGFASRDSSSCMPSPLWV